MYYALLAQQDSTWTFQATQMNTEIFGIHIEPDQIKTIGPILLLILIPLWKNYLIPLLKYFNMELNSLYCITLGGFCAVVSFLCAAFLQIKIENSENNHQINAVYQLPQFLFLMLGEVWLSIPALEFVYTNSPPRMKSMMTAFWFCNNAFGNLIVVIIVELNFVQAQAFQFLMYGGLMLITMIIFIFLARNYRRHSFVTLYPMSLISNNDNILSRETVTSQI